MLLDSFLAVDCSSGSRGGPVSKIGPNCLKIMVKRINEKRVVIMVVFLFNRKMGRIKSDPPQCHK